MMKMWVDFPKAGVLWGGNSNNGANDGHVFDNCIVRNTLLLQPLLISGNEVDIYHVEGNVALVFLEGFKRGFKV